MICKYEFQCKCCKRRIMVPKYSEEVGDIRMIYWVLANQHHNWCLTRMRLTEVGLN